MRIVAIAPRDESGTLLPPVVVLLLFGAALFILMVEVFSWVRGQTVPHL